MSNFDGRALRLRPNDVAEIAAMYNLREAHLRTVIDVETSGKGFDSTGHVERLFEPHKFYAAIKGNKAKLSKAVSAGVAYPKWKGPGSYPKTPTLRWKQFLTAYAIDPEAAICSASWGLGQIMGSEYAEAGYDSAEAMVQDFADGERQQIIGMANLIKARKLDVQLRKFPDMTACRNFARRYNGAQYERNKYHIKLHDAFIRWDARDKAPQKVEVSSGTLPIREPSVIAIGEHSDRVKKMQEKLNELGYPNDADGKFGPETRGVVLKWQADNERPTDGTMDAEDLAALEESPPAPVVAERVETTMDDLKKTSSIVSTGDTTNKIIGGATITGAVAKGADSLGLLDQASDIGDKAQAGADAIQKTTGALGTVKETIHMTGIDKVLLFVNEHIVIIGLVAFVFVFCAVRYMMRKRLVMTQTGQAVK